MSSQHFTRRNVLAAGAATLVAGPAAAEAPLGDDGLYHQPWFVESFLDLADDVATAAKAGRRFALVIEQRGCPYCRDMNLVNFADPAIVDYVRSNFDLVQIDLHGAREVTDFDGTKSTEKAFAARYAARVTPTILFFPEVAEDLSAKAPAERTVARMPGYLPPQPFLAFFRYVHDRAYEKEAFQDWVIRTGGRGT